MADANPAIEKLSHARSRCTCTIADAEREVLERCALERMAQTSHVKGFRAGKTPLGIIKEQTKPETLTEEIVHAYLREYLPKFLKEQRLTPIIPPKVELLSHAPLTLRITIIEKPTATFPKKDALRIPKKEETSRTEREEAFFTQIQATVAIDLAPELLEDEEREMLRSLQAMLQSENISFADWLKRTGRSEEAFRADLRNQAGRRLRIRFGIDALLAEHQITVADEEISKEIEEFLRSLPSPERDRLAPLYAPGGEGRERFRWQRRLQKLLAVFLD